MAVPSIRTVGVADLIATGVADVHNWNITEVFLNVVSVTEIFAWSGCPDDRYGLGNNQF